MLRKQTRSGLVRKLRNQRYSSKSWVGCLEGYPAFIVGNGPSINENDLSSIEAYWSIGINRSFIKLDTTVLMWQDISLWNSEYGKLHNTQAIKFARDIADPRRIYHNFYLKSGPYKFDKNKTHILNGRGSTGGLAAQLAVAMGATHIVLLGMDCTTGKNGETNFYGNNRFHLPHTMQNCLFALEFVKKECPVPVINCSNNQLWKKHSLSEALKIVDPNNKFGLGRQHYVKKILG